MTSLQCSGVVGNGKIPPTCQLTLTAGRRAGPKVIKVTQLSLPLSHCSTWARRPCSSPNSRVDLALDVGVGREPTPKGMSVGEPSLILVCCIRGRDSFTSLLPSGSGKPGPIRVMGAGKLSLPLTFCLTLGGQAIHLTWEAQENCS